MKKNKKILLVLATTALTIGCIIAFELSERFARSKNEAETTTDVTEKQTTVVTTVSESVTEEVSETTPSVQEMEETESVPVINIENNEQVRKLIGDEGISIVIKCVNETVIGYGYQNSSSVSYREMSVSDDSIQLEFVINIKDTSVLNVIGVSELFLMAKTAGGAYYKYFESYIVISIIYFILCFVFNRVFSVIEKKLQGRSDYELATEYLENE